MKWTARIPILAFALVSAALTLSCNRSSPTEPARQPSWLGSLIAQIQSEPVTSPPSSIVRYRYRGDLVYFRAARCCDFPSVLYDAQGTLVCNPDGGLAGGGDARCPDFFSARSEEMLVWQDARR